MSAKPTASLAFMRVLATGLLALMVVLFLVARAHESGSVWISYVRAFAEAATVGALADWFAVTALFRHPLGLPIPHTAIIPKSKDRIGEGLGHFLERNFLAPELVEERLKGADLLGAAAKWAGAPGRAALVAQSAAEMLPRALDMIDDSPVESALKTFIGARLKSADMANWLASLLEFLTAGGRHRGLMDHLIQAADALLNESEMDIRARIKAHSGFFARLFSLDKRASDAIVNAARGAIGEMANDPNSDLRRRFDEALIKLASDLRQSAQLRAEIEDMKERLLEHPEVQAFAGALWRAVKSDLQSGALGAAEGGIAKSLEEAVLGFARRIQSDDALRAVLNERLSMWIKRLATDRGGDVSRFVADTIKGWDARTVMARIEAGVGADLQYIRISGTLIGGLVGVILHVIEQVWF
jgi:uncharacterized membrane-anchored protein YjiN (DUF445 family)